MRRSGGALVCACVLIVAGTPAGAHDVHRTGSAYDSPTFCLAERAVAGHGTGGKGRSTGELFSQANDGQRWCARPVKRSPGYLAQRLWIYFRRNGSTEAGLCVYTDWTYNPATVDRYAVYYEPLTPACGPGLYATRAWASMWNADRWTPAGYADSGWHQLG